MDFILVEKIAWQTNAFLSQGFIFIDPIVVRFPWMDENGDGRTGFAIISKTDEKLFNDTFAKLSDPSCSSEDDYKKLMSEMPCRCWCGSINRDATVTFKNGTTTLRKMQGSFCEAVREQLGTAKESTLGELQSAIDAALNAKGTNMVVVNQENDPDDKEGKKKLFGRSYNGKLYPIWQLDLVEPTTATATTAAKGKGKGKGKKA